MRKSVFILFVMCLFTLSATAQGRPVRDKDKENVIRSTERSHWNFSPDWYMYFMHKKYSGAYTKWEWHGFHSGLRVHFKEDKSNTKTVGPRREKAVIAEFAKDSVLEIERQKIEQIKNQAEEKAADRNVDLMYYKYKDIFSDMQTKIANLLSYCVSRSKGALTLEAKAIADKNEVITSSIAYIHKQGIGYELENSKRENAYAKAKKDMQNVLEQAEALTRYAIARYD